MPDNLPTRLDYYSSQIPDDYAVRRALQSLGDIGYTGQMLPRVQKWEDFPYHKEYEKKGMPRPTGWTDIENMDPNNPSFVVADYGKTYQRALKGDEDAIKSLAGVFGHEDYHIQHGKEERPAYNKQLDILESLRASPRAKDEVLEAQRWRGYK